VQKKQVGVVEYRDLRFSIEDAPFIETGNYPYEAKVIGKTWHYVNKHGGPDRRFKDNKEFPVVEYELITLSSSTGLLEAFMVSRKGVFSQIQEAVKAMAGPPI